MAKKKKDELIPASKALAKVIDEKEFADLVQTIKNLIRQHKLAAWKHVNNELLLLYWEIGAEISRRQAIKGWGEAVVEELAKELQNEYPGEKGYSARNLWRMRTFYAEYTSAGISANAIGRIRNGKTANVIGRNRLVAQLRDHGKMQGQA